MGQIEPGLDTVLHGALPDIKKRHLHISCDVAKQLTDTQKGDHLAKRMTIREPLFAKPIHRPTALQDEIIADLSNLTG